MTSTGGRSGSAGSAGCWRQDAVDPFLGFTPGAIQQTVFRWILAKSVGYNSIPEGTNSRFNDHDHL